MSAHSDEIDRRLDELDLSLFEPIESQTTPRDRRALISLQSAARRRFGEYVYLEIGSHLGGSLQPHLRDPRCRRIYSIDLRPIEQPDDRGKLSYYPDNSTERMLDGLRPLAPARIDRIVCFDSDASAVDPAAIDPKPHLCFIDGEHTFASAVSDFAFCERVVRSDGAVCFHDSWIVAPAIRAIRRRLEARGATFAARPIGGSLYVIAFGEPSLLDTLVPADPPRNERWILVRWLFKRLYHRLILQPARARGLVGPESASWRR